MKKALEQSSRFTVDVATTPAAPHAPQKPKEPTKPKAPDNPKDNLPDSLKKYDEAKKKYDKDLKKYNEDKENFEKNKDKLLEKYEEAKKAYDKELPVYKEEMAKFHPDLTKYDVVLSNYNGDTWPKELQEDLEKALKAGKIGLVIIHAANNSFT